VSLNALFDGRRMPTFRRTFVGGRGAGIVGVAPGCAGGCTLEVCAPHSAGTAGAGTADAGAEATSDGAEAGAELESARPCGRAIGSDEVIRLGGASTGTISIRVNLTCCLVVVFRLVVVEVGDGDGFDGLAGGAPFPGGGVTSTSGSSSMSTTSVALVPAVPGTAATTVPGAFVVVMRTTRVEVVCRVID
jgi:hypothetical protein